jgi:hypothetical protein
MKILLFVAACSFSFYAGSLVGGFSAKRSMKPVSKAADIQRTTDLVLNLTVPPTSMADAEKWLKVQHALVDRAFTFGAGMAAEAIRADPSLSTNLTELLLTAKSYREQYLQAQEAKPK